MTERAQTFHVVTVVWGRPYVELFLDVAVPNQMTPGNLGALPAGSRYRVFTSPEDARALAASPALGRVKEQMPVDLVVMPELSDPSVAALLRMTAAHRRALSDARDVRAGLVFLNADHFLSEGAFAAVMRRHAAGSRAVVSPGIRLNKEPFVASLQGRGAARSVESRDLVALALNNLHRFTTVHMIDAVETACSPISVYWSVPGEGILARCFYMHPLMIDPVRCDVALEGTLDQHYLVHACPAREQVHVVTDSDELVVFEMSDVDGAVTETEPGGIPAWRAARILSRCDSHQQSYWTLPIRLHAGEIGASWALEQKRSARFARQVIWLRMPALWLHVTSRRLRPLRRRAGALRKQLRAAAKPLRGERIRRSVVRAVRPIQKLPSRATRAGRRVLQRARRSVLLLTHSAARPVQKLRKRAARMGRRVLRRARLAH